MFGGVDSVANGLLQFGGVQLAVDTAPRVPCSPTSCHADVQQTGTELRLVKVDEDATELHVDIFDCLVGGDGTLRITISLALNKAIVADSVLLGCGPRACKRLCRMRTGAVMSTTARHH